MADPPPEPEFEYSSCANCGAMLVGEYCHVCGQRNKHYVRSIFILVGEFLQDFANWDSRALRTLVPLMFRPGFLSTEFVVGRRERYVPPIRLYLFISIVFFVVLAAVTDFDTSELQRELNRESAEQAEPAVPPAEVKARRMFQIPFIPTEMEDALNERAERLKKNPDVLIRQAKSLAPQMMFLLLPLFAFILKIFYLFSKRYYMEHLVLALHTHSFMFMSFMALFGLGGIRNLAATSESIAWAGAPAGWLMGLVWAWIPIYLLLAQKRFYGQGWFLTVIKYLMTGFTYFMMVTFALVALLIASVATA